MISYNPPKVINYKIELADSIYKLYKSMFVNQTYKIDIDAFDDKEAAIVEIKKFMDRGAYTFCHFTHDYKYFVVFRNEFTDNVIKEAKSKKEKKDGEKE